MQSPIKGSSAAAGTTRFLPAQLLGPQFAVLSSGAARPVVVTHGDGTAALRLSSALAPGSGTAPSGVLSAAPFGGDQIVDLYVAGILRKAPNYEAMPVLVLASPRYNLSTNTGPRVQLGLKLHATINDSFCGLQVFSNASTTPSEAEMVPPPPPPPPLSLSPAPAP